MPKKTIAPGSQPAKPLPDAALELIAHRFRALSEPVRLRLLNTLMAGEKNVGQLAQAAGTGQANVSKHLSVLKEARMIATRRKGLVTICRISDPAIHQLCAIMCGKLKAEHEEISRGLEDL